MRSSPEVTRDNELVVLKGGVPLIVLDETDAWLQVRTDDADPVTGWVAKDFVRLGERLVLAPE
jgi:SH3-like domain-containing protein